jgi:crotonobetainyl-CoA:carnitine CoA-transferase CaiB-like acyl-CoA transferase
MTEEKTEGMLGPYRVLDLADEKGLQCGKLLGDLGADVIKVERPGGDPARNQGPFYHDEVDPEKSLFWFAYNASKRGITLDIEKPEGQKIIKRLVKTADFIVESFAPGYMDKIGLGYSELEKIRPGLIMVAISPFGQTGPYRDLKYSDLVLRALGGRLYAVGDYDRPPTRISHHPQLYLQAGLEGAMAAVMALHYRNMTGEGQYIDLSIQAAAIQTSDIGWDARKIVNPRGGQITNLNITRVWKCKDGIVNWAFMPVTGTQPNRNLDFVRWMDSLGYADDYIKNFDWSKYDMATMTQEVIDRLAEPTAKFFAAQTKVELLQGAVKHRIFFYPQFTTKDILESEQLAAREFWVDLEHPELGTAIRYPGPFAKISETPIKMRRRAPLIGEHNEEIYVKELGMSKKEIQELKKAKVI